MVLRTNRILTFLLIINLFYACRNQSNEADETTRQYGTPVIATTIVRRDLTETVELNATSSFLLKSPVKSIANGYIRNIKIKQGDFVQKGQELMLIITKEAQSLGSEINNLDTSFHFKGGLPVLATGSGYVSQLNFQSGDYVQDGEQIATISDSKSFVFILDLPYEMTTYMKQNKNIQLILPDSSVLNGTVEKSLPTVDAVSQTQSYYISVNSNKMIPENLIARAVLIKNKRLHATSVPKAALLTDEIQSKFWVMKLLNDSIAVKVPVQKGIETGNTVEILSPEFSDVDRIIISGNYGLPDTAFVTIKK